MDEPTGDYNRRSNRGVRGQIGAARRSLSERFQTILAQHSDCVDVDRHSHDSHPGAIRSPSEHPLSGRHKVAEHAPALDVIRLCNSLLNLVEEHISANYTDASADRSTSRRRRGVTTVSAFGPRDSHWSPSSARSISYATTLVTHPPTPSEIPLDNFATGRYPTNALDTPTGVGIIAATAHAVCSSRCYTPDSVHSLLGSIKVAEIAGTMNLLPNGNVTICDYEIIGELGRGSYGVVVLAIRTADQHPVAIKSLPYKKIVSGGVPGTSGEKHPVETEVALMKKMRHKNLVKLFAVIEDEDQQQCHLVMQYVENGPIATLSALGTCPPMPLMDALRCMIQVSLGLDYLHHHGILHRDVKPENILIGIDGTAFLADFGVSSCITDVTTPVDPQRTTAILPSSPPLQRKSNLPAGTLPFLAPETFIGDTEKAAAIYGIQMDIWAFGVTLYVLLYGKLPFFGMTQSAVISNILQSSLEVPVCPGIPEAVGDVIRQLLHRDPSQRLSLRAFRGKARRILADLPTTTDGHSSVMRDLIVSREGGARILHKGLDPSSAMSTHTSPTTRNPPCVYPGHLGVSNLPAQRASASDDSIHDSFGSKASENVSEKENGDADEIASDSDCAALQQSDQDIGDEEGGFFSDNFSPVELAPEDTEQSIVRKGFRFSWRGTNIPSEHQLGPSPVASRRSSLNCSHSGFPQPPGDSLAVSPVTPQVATSAPVFSPANPSLAFPPSRAVRLLRVSRGDNLQS